MRQSPAPLAIVACLICLSGCREDPAGSSFGSGGSEAGRFCQEFMATLSERIPMCLGGRPETWRRLYTYLQPDLCEDYAAAVTAGRRRFDGAAASACLNLVAAATCDTPVTEPSPCEAAFPGAVPAGGACQAGDECAEGSCLKMGDACGGQCEDLPDLGEACSGQRCARNARCDGGRCVASVRSMSGGPCFTSFDCAQGVLQQPLFACVGPATGSRTCQPRRTAGTCGDSLDCQAKYFCDPATHECRPRLAPGAGPCSPAQQDQCMTTTYCLAPEGMTTGTCVELVAADGAPCGGPESIFSRCAGWCELASPTSQVGVCRPPKPAGATCANALECADRRCDLTAHTCLPACPR
jgi:hypothetical protein